MAVVSHPLLDNPCWGKSVNMPWDTLWKGPCGKGMRPANHCMSELGSRSLHPTPVSLQMRPQSQVAAWLQPHEKPWTRGTQLSCACIPVPQKPWDNICCLRLFSLAVFCYALPWTRWCPLVPNSRAEAPVPNVTVSRDRIFRENLRLNEVISRTVIW